MRPNVLGAERSALELIARQAAFLTGVGLSFGFVSTVFAVGYASYARLPDGVAPGNYVTLGRREADTGRFATLNQRDFEMIRSLAPEYEWSYAPFYVDSLAIRSDGRRFNVTGRVVSRGHMKLLRVAAAVGSTWSDGTMEGRSAVISEGLWQDLHGRSPAAIGDVLEVEDDRPLTIVGVAAGFSGTFIGPYGQQKVDLWISAPTWTGNTTAGGLVVFGALRDGTTLTALRSLLSSYRFPGAEHDALEVAAGLEPQPDARLLVRRSAMWLALVVGLLLTLSFLCLVDFLLADHYAGAEAQAVKLAVGATPTDVFRETVAKHGMWLGGTIVVTIASFAFLTNVFLGIAPFSSYLDGLTAEASLAGVSASIVLLVAAFVASAARVSWFVASFANVAARVDVRTRTSRVARGVLLAVAGAGLLLVFSLCLRYVGDAATTLGFEHGDVLMMGVIPPSSVTVEEAVSANAHVLAHGKAEMLPLLAETVLPVNRQRIAGRVGLEDVVFYRNGVSRSYFETLGVGVVAGRLFDGISRSEIVLAEASAARLAGSPEEALDMSIQFVPDDQPDHRPHTGDVVTVVGVVDDVAYGPVNERPKLVYYRHFPEDYRNFQGFRLIRHTAQADFLEWLREQGGDIQDVYRIGTAREIFDEQFLSRRSVEVALAIAAAFAVILALAGLANSLARSMTAEIREIGIRFALGATTSDITRQYGTRTLTEVTTATAVLCAVVVAAKIGVPVIVSVVDLWLVSGVVFILATQCLLVVHVLARRLAKADANTLVGPYLG